MPPDLTHLLDLEDEPDNTPRRREPVFDEDVPQFVGGNGISVQQSGDAVLISLEEETAEVIRRAESQTPDDPLENMPFRVSVSDGEITVKRGYFTWVEWRTDGWYHVEVEVPEQVIELPAGACEVFVVIPCRTFKNETDSHSKVTPYISYTSDPQTIEGEDYFFTIESSTDYTGLDQTLFDAESTSEPPTIAKAYTAIPTADGNYRQRVANINASGGVNQTFLGTFALPQTFTTRTNRVHWT